MTTSLQPLIEPEIVANMKSMLTVIILGSAALANAVPYDTSPYQVSVHSYMDDARPITPAWKKEDNQRLIPISDKTRKGIVDPVVEEGLFALGKPAGQINTQQSFSRS